jgi:TPR repeat protein
MIESSDPKRKTERARRLYGLAAAQGHAYAQYNLGAMHDRGEGGPQDFAEARRLWGLAAAQGHAGAQYSLGRMHHRGEG